MYRTYIMLNLVRVRSYIININDYEINLRLGRRRGSKNCVGREESYIILGWILNKHIINRYKELFVRCNFHWSLWPLPSSCLIVHFKLHRLQERRCLTSIEQKYENDIANNSITNLETHLSAFANKFFQLNNESFQVYFIDFSYVQRVEFVMYDCFMDAYISK